MSPSAPNRIVAGNWKMNMDRENGVRLAADITAGTSGATAAIILAPPFVLLPYVAEATGSAKHVALAAQNCHHESAGAFTGEISASMLASAGCAYVIVGHSERRGGDGETDERVGEKLRQVLANSMRPILCCGEKEEERGAGRHFDRVRAQISAAALRLSEENAVHVVIAYEPVWAIGTGKNAAPEQAQEMHAFIRAIWGETFGSEAAGRLSILYGGSCNAENAGALFAQPDVNGGLIGGASLKAGEFIAIANAFPR